MAEARNTGSSLPLETPENPVNQTTDTPSALPLHPKPEIPFPPTPPSAESKPECEITLNLNIQFHVLVYGEIVTNYTDLSVFIPRDSELLWDLIETKYISDGPERDGLGDKVPLFWEIKSEGFQAASGREQGGTERMYREFKSFCQEKFGEEAENAKKAGVEGDLALTIDATVEIDFL